MKGYEGYFDRLIDTVSLDAVEAANDACTQHTWHGAGRQDEPTLLAGIRALIDAVRAEEAAKYLTEARRLREFNEDQDRRRNEQYVAYVKSMDQRIKDAVAQRDAVASLVRHARSRKTIRTEALRVALNMQLRTLEER